MISRSQRRLSGMVCVILGMGLAVMVQASGAAESHGRPALQSQLNEVDAKVADARTRNEKLQAQVAQMERQNADRQKQLQQRDEEIAALQEKLRAAGAPASATTSGE